MVTAPLVSVTIAPATPGPESTAAGGRTASKGNQMAMVGFMKSGEGEQNLDGPIMCLNSGLVIVAPTFHMTNSPLHMYDLVLKENAITIANDEHLVREGLW